MHGFFLKAETDSTSSEYLKKIIHNRAALVEEYATLIGILDESDARKWGQIIAAAREAGLGKDVLCEAFSCSWSTVLRWEAGRNAPGPFARKAMKAKLLEMLASRREAELGRSKKLLSKERVAA